MKSYSPGALFILLNRYQPPSPHSTASPLSSPSLLTLHQARRFLPVVVPPCACSAELLLPLPPTEVTDVGADPNPSLERLSFRKCEFSDGEPEETAKLKAWVVWRKRSHTSLPFAFLFKSSELSISKERGPLSVPVASVVDSDIFFHDHFHMGVPKITAEVISIFRHRYLVLVNLVLLRAMVLYAYQGIRR